MTNKFEKLKDKIFKRIQNMSGNVILRREINSFGSPSQISRCIEALIEAKELVKIGHGIYAKSYISKYVDRPIIKGGADAAWLGHDGWADARYGDFDHSSVTLNDSKLITELFQAFLLNKSALKNEMQKLADADALILKETLSNAINQNIKKIIIATHVPPFPECCLHKGKQSDQDWLPYFSSQATGDVILNFTQKNPAIDILVLCGHTHSNASIKPYKNLEIKAGSAQYYHPELQEVILL